ncbi:hypothetical protein [Methylobacterium sp. MA0201]|uniref:hypothetical protein n=1 Tax=Methylobacterium alsaeris TaxID=3344826 RepID=UPI00375836CB
MRRILLLLCLLAVALGLAACHPHPELTAPAPVIRRVEVLGVRVPQRLRHCRPEPEPLPDDATVSDIAPHHVDVAAAGQDCRTKLGAVDRLLTAAERRAGGHR